VLGVDPNPRFVLQFEALRRLMTPVPAFLLPLRLNQLPPGIGPFDTVFSLGVLYHRRCALLHLGRLRQRLARGGELVLETLTLPDGSAATLVPQGRYAGMRNVWAIPTIATLKAWLRSSRYRNVRVATTATTTSAEQRATDWSTARSLEHALQPGNPRFTIEGHPAPRRTFVVAERE
jgi:tRNA (mo5U34)-methyltransferase